MTTILAADLGGSSLRVALVAFAGADQCRVGPIAGRPVSSGMSAGGIWEADAAAWWRLFVDAAGEALADGRVPDAISITGATRTQVLVDADGQPLRPAITFRDTRAVDEARELADVIAERPQLATAASANAFHPLARLLWIKRHEPHVLASAHAMLQPKDFLNRCLTGVDAGDLLSSSALLFRDGAPATALLAALGLDPALLPRLHAPHEAIGRVQSGLPAPFGSLAGTPVVAGTMDTWCNVLGSGASHDGGAYDVAGTSEVLGVIAARALAAPGLMAVPWGDGLCHLGGPTQAGADCLAWYLDAFGGERDPARAVAALTDPALADPTLADPTLADPALADPTTPPRSPRPILFLPYLEGERVPIWDEKARGVFFGIDRSHRAADFLWAVLEGVAFANRHVLDLAEAALGAPVAEVRISGGGARLDLWCQIKADVTGRPYARAAEAETGLLGAALVGLRALGRVSDDAEAQRRFVRVDRVFTPDPARHRRYDPLYRVYRDLQLRSTEPFAALASLASPR